MNERMKRFLKGQMVSSVFYIVLGLCLVIMPVQMANVICKVVFGLVLIGAGCYHIFIYVEKKQNSSLLDLFSGSIVLVLGGFLFFNPQIVVKLLPILLGVFILVDSVWLIQGCLRLKKENRKEWSPFFAAGMLLIALGIVLLVNPFSSVKATVIFAGAVVLANGIEDVAFLFFMKKARKYSASAGENLASAAEDVQADETKDAQADETKDVQSSDGTKDVQSSDGTKDAQADEAKEGQTEEAKDAGDTESGQSTESAEFSPVPVAEEERQKVDAEKTPESKDGQRVKLTEIKATWDGEPLEEWKD